MINKFIRLLNKYDSIIIFGHMNCDGDCFSSQIAMYEFIKNNFKNKKVYLVGSGVEKMFSLFFKPHVLDDEIFFSSLGIALDFNEDYRCEDQRIFNCKELAVIDHHNVGAHSINNTSFSYIDNSASSCASLLYKLLVKKCFKISNMMLTALFYGIVADTNRFMYLENDLRSLTICKKLIKLGVDYKSVYQNISLTSLSSFKVTSYIYSNFKIDNKVIYCVVPKEIKNSFLDVGYIGKYVNTLGNLNGIEVWILFIENDDDTLTVEFRSKSVGVVSIAKKYGGGGHNLACGIQKINFKNDLISNIIKDINKVLNGEGI